MLSAALTALTFYIRSAVHCSVPTCSTHSTQLSQYSQYPQYPAVLTSTVQYPHVFTVPALPTVPSSTNLQYPHYRDCHSTHGKSDSEKITRLTLLRIEHRWKIILVCHVGRIRLTFWLLDMTSFRFMALNSKMGLTLIYVEFFNILIARALAKICLAVLRTVRRLRRLARHSFIMQATSFSDQQSGKGKVFLTMFA